MRIEIGPFLSHQLQIVVGGHRPVLDLCAAGDSRGSHSFFVSVHQRAQAQLLRFIASCVQLLLRQSHRAALTNALRGEDLDQVGAGFFLLSNERANFSWRAGALASPGEWFDSCQDARPWQQAFRDRVSQRHVGGRAHALDRREARHQSHPCVGGGRIRGLLGRASRTSIFSIRPEAPGHVDVRVNPSG